MKMVMLAASVIIPTYNRSQKLKQCLAALEKQTFSGNWEVVIVNDGGDVDLNDLVAQFQSQIKVRLYHQENKGPAAARNLGAKLANGEYLVFLDDDCEPHHDWLETLLVHVQSGVLVGGKTVNALIDNLYSECCQQLVSFLLLHWKGTPWYFFTSNNFALDKDTFTQVGGFDEAFQTSAGEDREFCLRWIHLGYGMKYVPEIIIDHRHDLTFLSFWALHVKYGQAAKRFREKGIHLGIPSLNPSVGFYYQLMFYPFKSYKYLFVEKVCLMSLMFLSQVATLIGVIKTSKK